MVPVALAVLVAGGAFGGLAGARLSRDSSDPVLRAVANAAASGALSQASAAFYRETYTGAVAEVARLHGLRAQELGSAIAIVRGIAARGSLLPSRMPLVFLTLQRNVQWWGSRGPPSPGSGVEPAAQGRVCKPLASPEAHAANLTFPGSGIVYEYYPGMGLQLQVNATFGAVNALLTEGSPRSLAQAGATLDEMLKLASYRQGRLTWEYEFPFEGAEPPWTSGLSQATAIEALTRAAAKLGRPDYLTDALRLTRLFAVSPPTGMQLHLRGGDWFLLYSFAPDQIVLNADLDAVIALHDLRVATHQPRVTALAHSGLHALETNIARFNIGTWSLYALGGPLADLNYQALNLELAQKLCQRTGIAPVCGAARSFGRELNARCPLVKHGANDPDTLEGDAFGAGLTWPDQGGI
jgi:D-glucuronyl C5-epimerase-like protein